ncbi:hypothetical protein K458DRAFT_464486 [Lentithecium fluviatile CBS 122367]|uniref:GED domain-containing protein n=1 Tax=Lentithecium fluviatile CBS 122367 TaxID=1168545 RepID=A0A6G1IIP2_9PLEO|nr:hypothetical protein K458DRAFT_464486 [Lentithecium fluviatile CBS 122367]
MDSYRVVSFNLLNKIDRLFEYNVGELAPLPQIVVVGDQSSGKNSVLEGLTGLPFPRESGLCTRFATQIIFRRLKSPGIAVSIIPAKNSNLEDGVKLQGWKKLGLNSLDPTLFVIIMDERTEGVSKPFSDNVLRLEIAGPDQEHFSVIDVTGIFKRTTSGLTTKDDIFNVVPCNVDIATQEILERAEEMDRKTHQLRLDWHILRNTGQSELFCSSRERLDLGKKFFSHERPWNTLDEGKLGIEPLCDRLQEILGDHIRREFPKVEVEISQILKKLERELESLGLKRQSQTEQCQYLMDMPLEFQNVVSHAVHSDYSRSNILTTNKELRIATEANKRVSVRNSGEIFSWLKKEYRESRGFELGNFDTSLLIVTMKQQAANWSNLALGYISDVISLVHSFILGVLDHITPNDRVRDGIRTHLLDEITKMYQNAINEDHTALEIYDILSSYYKVARKHLVDCVCMQVADTPLVTGSKTPLALFSAKFVMNMSREALEDVAGEDGIVKRRRDDLKRKIIQLQEGKRIVG